MTDLTHTLYLDFEWQSRLSIRKHGLYRVSRDPSTRILCCAWAVHAENGPVVAMNGDEPLVWAHPAAALAGLDLIEGGFSSTDDGFVSWAKDPGTRVVAHNAEVEREVLLTHFGVEVPWHRVSCTAARAARRSLPRALEDVCQALNLDAEKDMDGHRVMMKLARPRRPSREDRSEFWSEAKKHEDYQSLYDYCSRDVEALVAVDRALPELEPGERAAWEMTARSNERGVAVDSACVMYGISVAEHEQKRLAARFEQLVGAGPASPRARELLGMGSLDKASVRDELKRADLTPEKREALEIRQAYAKSSVKKLQAFEDRTCKDGRLRGSLLYAGAERTARWSGAGVQPQNFPRGLGEKTDEAFEHLEAGALDLFHERPLDALAGMLRGFLVGPFLVGDFAQVEARVLAWLAGQDDLVEMFRSGVDVYCVMATDIYGRPITKKEHPFERFIGKESTLGCGYGLGSRKFREALQVKADVEVTEEFAEKVVKTFRRRFPKIVRLWELLERGLLFVVRNRSRRVKVGPVHMGTEELAGVPYAWIELPSGRRIYYAWAEEVDGEVRYLGRNQYKGGAWETVHTYGGKATENVVQAVSRDLLLAAMVRVEALGLPTALTVHDEDVVEGGPEQLGAFAAALAEVPEWAKGLPLAVECFACRRYRK